MARQKPPEIAPTGADRAVDPRLSAHVARAAEEAGVVKARMPVHRLFMLAVLGGAFIAFGAIFSTVVLSGGEQLPYGVGRLLAGLVFSLGLILVIAGGAELFTGDTLMAMAAASGRLRIDDMLRIWAVVLAGNAVGAVGTAALAFAAGEHQFGGGSVGATALAIGVAKSSLPFGRALMLGVLCNVLVCLAIWMSIAARSLADKVLVIVPPVAAFVAAGFEHSVANLYYLPFALLIKWGAAPEFWQAIGHAPQDFAALGLGGAVNNLVPVVIGNIIGGAGLVGAVYWAIYLRGERDRR